MATPSLGSIGEKLDLVIRQGGTFGPFEVALKNPDGTAVDLTGSEIRGQIRKKALDVDVIVALDVVINPDQVDEGKGKFTFGLDADATADIVAGEVITEAASVYVWDMEWQDSLMRVTPMYYGGVKVQREVTRV